MTADIDLVRIVDLVIAITVLEGCALAAYRWQTGRGLAPRDFLANMLAGLALMLALRCLASASGIVPVAACLLAAGLAHAVDIGLRLRRRRTASVEARAAA